jgi:hypothetical protein
MKYIERMNKLVTELFSSSGGGGVGESYKKASEVSFGVNYNVYNSA